MFSPLELFPFVLLGIVGSLHCAGMCGGFALGVAASAESRKQGVWIPRGLYFLGKSFSYAVLALLVASGSAGLTQLASDAGGITTTRELLAWVAGTTLIVMGLSRVGLRFSSPSSRSSSSWGRATAAVRSFLRPVWSSVTGLSGSAGFFGTGIVNGLLPCGLSWSALVLASQYSPIEAAAGAFLFGLATVPSLLLVSLVPRLVGPRLRRHGPLLLGSALVLMGTLTLLRGGLGNGGENGCCAETIPAAQEANSVGSP